MLLRMPAESTGAWRVQFLSWGMTEPHEISDGGDGQSPAIRAWGPGLPPYGGSTGQHGLSTPKAWPRWALGRRG